jgi:3-oxoacyl-[acyl-carrier-protein] synthase II
MGTTIDITGVGCISHAGRGLASLSAALRTTPGPASMLPVQFDVAELGSDKRWRRADPVARLAAIVARDAVADAGLTKDEVERATVIVGSAYGGIQSMAVALDRTQSNQVRPVPTFVASIGPASIAAAVCTAIGCRGFAQSIDLACATGTALFHFAAAAVANGAQTVIVVGAEAPAIPVLEHAYSAMGLLSEAGCCRPFDADRDGFTISEGAAAFVLRRADDNQARYGRITASDSRIDPDGTWSLSQDGQTLADLVHNLLGSADLAPSGVGAINPHGTGTATNDAIEASVYARVGLADCPVSAPKGALGHAGGAAGALEIAASLCWFKEEMLPATAGSHRTDPDFNIDLVLAHRSWEPSPVLCTSVGLGGFVAGAVLIP